MNPYQYLLMTSFLAVGHNQTKLSEFTPPGGESQVESLRPNPGGVVAADFDAGMRHRKISPAPRSILIEGRPRGP